MLHKPIVATVVNRLIVLIVSVEARKSPASHLTPRSKYEYPIRSRPVIASSKE